MKPGPEQDEVDLDDKTEATTPGPSRFLDEILPRIQDLMNDPSSEKLVDIPKNVDEKSFYNEKSGANQPVRPDLTDIKSKYTTPTDKNVFW